MEGLLIVIAVMLLFAVIASSRFRMLRKMADQVFNAFEKPALERYEMLSRFISENRDLEGIQKQARDIRQLEALLDQKNKEALSVNQQVELENKVSSLEDQLLKKLAEDNTLSNKQWEAVSELREVRDKLDQIKKQYNDTVIHYNNAVYLFPSNVFALVFGYNRRKTFKPAEE